MNVYWRSKIEFIRDKQIPRLEKQVLSRLWDANGFGSVIIITVRKTEKVTPHTTGLKKYFKRRRFRILVPYARAMEEQLAARYKDAMQKNIESATAEEYRIIDGKPRYWTQEDIMKDICTP